VVQGSQLEVHIDDAFAAARRQGIMFLVLLVVHPVLSVPLVVTAMAVVVCSHPYSRGAFPSRGDVKRGKSGVRPALSRNCHRRPNAAEARMPASATMPSTFARKGAG
jgi:hypothetical protein